MEPLQFPTLAEQIAYWNKKEGDELARIEATTDWFDHNNKGEECIYCGKDSWTCEHFNPQEEAKRNQ